MTHALDIWRNAGANFARSLDCFRLSWLHGARSLSARFANSKIAFWPALYIHIFFAHITSPLSQSCSSRYWGSQLFLTSIFDSGALQLKHKCGTVVNYYLPFGINVSNTVVSNALHEAAFPVKITQ